MLSCIPGARPTGWQNTIVTSEEKMRGLDRKLPELKMFASGAFRSHIAELDVHRCFLLGIPGCTWLQDSLTELICERVANQRRHKSPSHAEEENYQC